MDRLHGGYSMSEANQKISNLKIPMSCKETGRWYYKQTAIQNFACDLAKFTMGFKTLEGLAFVPMPPSKRRDDPDYDDRVFCACLTASTHTKIPTFDILEQKTSHKPYHEGNTTRNIEMIQSNLLVAEDAIPDDIYAIILVDDVLTTGAHFVACSNVIESAYPTKIICGAFWAKQVTYEAETAEELGWF